MRIKRLSGLRSSVLVGTAAVALCALTGGGAVAAPNVPDPSTGFLLNGRQLTPAGKQVKLGNFPGGAAVTADGRFLWTVSAGFGRNDVRILDVAGRRVIQTIQLAGSSGGVALDSARRLAYVSGLQASRWWPSQSTLPGGSGDVILVYRWNAHSGAAGFVRTISVAPPAGTAPVQAYPVSSTVMGWPQQPAVSPDGSRLLVPLNLADLAAVVDLTDRTAAPRYVQLGSGAYPYGAAVLPDGRTGLVSNEAAGTVSVLDLAAATKLRDITVGPPLSHPQDIVVDRGGRRAYVALSASDEVVVVDLRRWQVERTISVGRNVGLGTMPVSLALSPQGTRLFVAESGADEIAVVRLPGRKRDEERDWTLVGRIPTSDDPKAVRVAAARDGRAAQLLYVAARGTGVGPNVAGPDPTDPYDPVFWAFNFIVPTTDVFSPRSGTTYLPGMIVGRAGILPLPSNDEVRRLSPAAAAQLRPQDPQKAPKGTPLRAGGPIKYVFFVVRENRSYDQLLGDLGHGNGDPKLVVFGKEITPNLHSLVTRFPLLDHVYANSEASIQGHFWTAAAAVPDYVDRNWVHEYDARGRPNDFGTYAVSFPGNGFLFYQAERQHISYFNYGEGISGDAPELADRARTPELQEMEEKVAAHSDLGPGLTDGGTYPSDLGIGQVTGADPQTPNVGEIFDSYLPSVRADGSFSHLDSFRDPLRAAARRTTRCPPSATSR